jgi:hypothetical protein
MNNPISYPRLLLFLLLAGLLLAGGRTHTAAASSIEGYLNPDGTLNLPTGRPIPTLNAAGYRLVSGPQETPRFAPEFAQDNANWDPRFAQPDINNTVSALAWDGSSLYAGGSFTAAGLCLGCNRVARWDGSRWHPLAYGLGLSGAVNALVWDGANLYAGGSFTTLCNDTACTSGTSGYNRLARWDGTAWNKVNYGLGNTINALAWDGTNLYAGGTFTTICTNDPCTTTTPGYNRLARWDGTSWSTLAFGLNSTVNSLVWGGTNLYAGGGFSRRCNDITCTTFTTGFNVIARWDGTNWNTLAFGLNSTVSALAWDGTSLYVGGNFTRRCDDLTCSSSTLGYNRIVRWDGTTWNTLAFGLGPGATSVNTLAWDGSNLYVGGSFTALCADTNCTTTSTGYNRVARWNGTAWSATSLALNNAVTALVWNGGLLYAGGTFTALCTNTACTTSTPNFNRLASWNGSSWQRLEGQRQGLNSTVSALAWDGTNLYAGGSFTAAGLCVGCNRVARWDGRRWQPLSYGLDGNVNALLWTGSTLYAGGAFTNRCNDVPCMSGLTNGYNRVARWDGTAWQTVSFGLNGAVNALALSGTNLYVGGSFTARCTVAACTTPTAGYNRIARWDGTNWNMLVFGLNGTVNALAVNGTNIYVGGAFTARCTNTASSCTTTGNLNRVALWDGTAWQTLSFGLGPGASSVNTLAWDGTNLYAGGGFTRRCDDATCAAFTTGYNRIASWNGTTWNPLNFGLNSTVSALAWDGTNLYAGGSFAALCNDLTCTTTTTGYNYIARWDSTTWSTLGSGLDTTANSLAWVDGSLYDSLFAGGSFTLAGSKPSVSLGRWRFAAVWDGGGGDNNGSTAANWSGDTVPLSTDVAIFDPTSTKDATLDATFPAALSGLVLEEDYEGTVTQARDLALTLDLQLHDGTLIIADPTVNAFTLEGSILHSGGTLSQTRPVNTANVPFLHIQNAAATVTKYRGVELDTTTTAANLGNVAVGVRAVETAEGEYCTETGATSPAYATRCYTITPTTQGSARVRLYALATELNGVPEATLAVFRNVLGPNWEELTAGVVGTDGGSYRYAEGGTTGFSAFLLGEAGNTPTAVTLVNQTSALVPLAARLFPAVLTLFLATLLLYRRRSR